MEDAMAFTLGLGLRDLWIDQVCIYQSDPSGLHNHVAKMHMVYICVTVTIVAAPGHISTHFLPGVSISRISQAHIRLDLLADKPAYASKSESPKYQVFDSLWSTQAWTYQGGVVSRRRLVITPNQTMFQCQCATWTEKYQNDATRDIARGMDVFESLRAKDQTSPASRFYLLCQHIESYSGRNLSYQSDALNGLKGLLTIVRDEWQIPTFWGMPFSSSGDFAVSLLFNHYPDRYIHRAGFPSCSWTGWVGKTVYPGLLGRGRPGPAKDLQVSLQRTDGAFTEPNTTFTTEVTAELNGMPPNHTIKLRLVTIAFTLQAEEVPDFQDGPKTRIPRIGVRKSVNLDTSHPVCWSVHISAQTLHTLETVQDPLQVLLVHQLVGLLVHTCAGSTKCIGIVELSSECERHSPCHQHGTQHQPDFYTRSLRTVYLT